MEGSCLRCAMRSRMGKHVILKALDAQQTMGGQNRDLRGSNASSQAGSDVLHDSGMRSSSLSAAPDHEKTSAVNGGLRLLTKAVATRPSLARRTRRVSRARG